ncbi:MAG: YlmC/YmxH family sporulation protein [Clostridia bacterium]|nr:YlmC/YmxH family sporulation protein [Clostridia bacterium]
MTERVGELQKKEVINLVNGRRLGFVYDVEVDLEQGKVISVIVPGQNRFFRLFWKYEELVISFDQIKKIGDDIILVEMEEIHKKIK